MVILCLFRWCPTLHYIWSEGDCTCVYWDGQHLYWSNSWQICSCTSKWNTATAPCILSVLLCKYFTAHIHFIFTRSIQCGAVYDFGLGRDLHKVSFLKYESTSLFAKLLQQLNLPMLRQGTWLIANSCNWDNFWCDGWIFKWLKDVIRSAFEARLDFFLRVLYCILTIAWHREGHIDAGKILIPYCQHAVHDNTLQTGVVP